MERRGWFSGFTFGVIVSASIFNFMLANLLSLRRIEKHLRPQHQQDDGSEKTPDLIGPRGLIPLGEEDDSVSNFTKSDQGGGNSD